MSSEKTAVHKDHYLAFTFDDDGCSWKPIS